ncbi:MAG: LysR family transcriptional regulator [Comamonadaceae bacterium]|nr:MAG: LysR family transcriptional regulator [Comamonadaceae bacterium]
MELRHLKGFLAVAQEQSFTRAANRLNMAQPPLSLRIRELEEELGVKLFERHTRKVALSHAGKAFFDAVEPLLFQLERAVEACQQADRGETGRLRVGYTGRASHLLLPRVMMAFRCQFPQVMLDIEGPLPTGTLRLKLLDGELDVALCFLPLADAGIETRVFAASEFVLAMPASHRLAGLDPLPLSLLANDTFVGYPSSKGFHLRDAMDAECLRAGFQPRVVRETETSQVLLCLVASGAGSSIVPRELQTQEGVEGVVFKPLDANAVRLSHGLAWMTNNRNPALRSLLSLDLAPAR